ncbi:hypothetical protein QM012_001002 [Aureobasidium pullulans]|uniref:HECT-type E3 ubiquitin transferase n=1 Tax=Aureobasidium pullulans TaxID=5580 RepID=A0ABR0TGB0_AURPU
MAVVLASSEDAHKRLCPNLPSQLPAVTASVQERIDHKSIMQQLFNSESLRSIHLIKDADSLGPLNDDSSIEIPSYRSMSCDDLTKLCNTALSARFTVLPSEQDVQHVYLLATLRCLFSNFSYLAHSFLDNPMDILPGTTTSHSTIFCIKLHRVLELVHALGQDASSVVLDSIWQSLEPLFESPFDPKHTESRSFQTFPSDRKGSRVPSVVHYAIHALASFVPQASRESWHTVWSATVNGKAYGKQKRSSDERDLPPWLSILDQFEQEPALRMARRLIRAIGARTCLEETLVACDVGNAKPDPRLQIWKTDHKIRESIIDLLVSEEQSIRLSTFKTKYRDDLRHGGELVGTTSLIWLEWLRKCFLKEWDGSLRINRWSVAGSALELIEDLWKHRGRGQLDMPAKLFAFSSVFKTLDVDKAAQDWLSYKPDPNIRHLLSFKFLFDTRAVTSLVRTSHHILMRRAYNEADAVLHLRRRTMPQVNLQDVVYLDRRLRAAQDHYIVLKINRHSVLSDAFDQLWHREKRELLRPLRIRMGIDEGEIGHDLGGVQIEFFKLACQEAFNPAYSLFSIDPQTRLAWFQPATMVPLYKYQLFGLLIALAIYNGITLPVSFPLVFYKKLLFQIPSEADLAEGWPSLARSLQHLQMHKGSVEEDFSRDYVYSLDANGLNLDVSMDDPWDGWSVLDKIRSGKSMSLGRLRVMRQYPDKHHPPPGSTHPAQSATHKLPLPTNYTNSTSGLPQSQNQARGYHQSRFDWPGWKVEIANPGELPQPVTNDNRDSFISSYSKWVMDWSIRPQFNAFAKGFYSVMDLRPLTLLNADQFRTLVEGHNHLDINALQKATTYNHYTATSPAVRWFWEVVKAYPQEKQKQLLEFVTASSRVPVNGAESLIFVIERSDSETSALPGSSTCFGTLRLPEYESKEALASKLDIALEHSLGFGQA